MAAVAKEFGVLPSQAARAMDADSENLDILCVELLRYAEAKTVFDSNNKKAIEAWKGSEMMEEVTRNSFAAAERAMKRAGG